MALAVPPGGGPAPSGPVPRANPLRPALLPETPLRHAGRRLVPVARHAPRPVPRPSLPAVVPQLSVVIVNFCQWRNTARLTRQLRHAEAAKTGSAEIVIVDNHSPSHAVVKKLSRMEGVTVRRLSRNHGFARAVNRACRSARGEWVLLLNPDVSVPDGFLDDVQDAAEKLPGVDPRAGVLGFQLRNHDGSRQASSGPFPTLWNTVARLIRPRSRRRCEHRSLSERQPVAWVTGGCLLVRRECFDQLGGFDERFFLYYEDVDFCRRARELGWSVWYDPAIRVTHHWPLHARRLPAPLRLMTRHALLTYSRKHWSWWQARAMAGVVWWEAGLRRVWAAVRGDGDSARLYGQLRGLVGDVRHGRFDSARKRVRLAAAFLDPIAAEQDGRTE